MANEKQFKQKSLYSQSGKLKVIYLNKVTLTRSFKK